MEMIAACGLDCSSCPAYVNRNTTDREVLAKIAAEWTAQFKKEVKPEDVGCSGCQHVGEGKMFPYCHTCAIRACAHGKGYVTCAECDGFDACAMIQKFIVDAPAVRPTLESLRAR